VIDWLFTHRRSILFLLVVAALLGAVAAWRLPVGLFPNIDFPRVVVSVDAGDRPVERMVVEVTRPLEEAIREVPNVKSLRSTSSRGTADISVSFAWGLDMNAAQLQVESEVNRVVADLPPGTRFTVRRMDPTVFPVLGLTLTSEHRDLVSLRDLAIYRLRPLLASLPDVAQVEILGGQTAEYHVQIDPMRLASAGLSPQDVSQALSANNVVSAVGRLEDRYRLYLTLAEGRLADLNSIGHLVVKASPRGVITLSSVAKISSSTQPTWNRVTADGRDAVLINIRQSRGANAVTLADSVRSQLAAHASELPKDVRIGTFYDQSELVRAAAGSVFDAILIGAVLAGLIVLLFLRDVRLTFVVAIVLPAVLAVTSLLLHALGLSFNIMTLGGMAAAVGLVVDDAVVMVEHLVRRLHGAPESGRAAALRLGAQEMIRPLMGSSLATIVIFVPLAFLSGVTGNFFKALAVTMASALIVSFLVALFAVPLMTEWLARPKRTSRESDENSRFARLQRRYARVVESSLAAPRRVGLVALVLVALGAVAFWRLPSGFMPHMDEGGFILDYRAAPGVSLAETDRLLRQVETLIRETPEVVTYSRRTGLQLGGGLTEANEGDFFIKLKGGHRRNIEEIMTDVRDRVAEQVPGLEIETVQLMEDLIGDLTAVPQPIEVKIFGQDLTQLHREAPQIAARLEKIPGVIEVLDGLRIAGDALDVVIDPVRAAMEGLDADSIAKQLSILIGGNHVGVIQSGEKLVGIRLWSPQDLRARVESLSNLQLRAPDGHMVAVRRVADVRIVAGQPQIVREDLEQMVAVTARLEGLDLGSGMREVRKAVQELNLPKTIRVEYGGLYQEQQSSFLGLAGVFATAVLLVAALLLYLYERWAVVLAILATIAGSVCAVFIGLWATGTELDVSAMMGLTMIVGIVAEVAVFYFAELSGHEDHSPQALVSAGVHRLRPIVMTSLIAILALLPLALRLGTGAEMQTPLAIAIISGLIAAVPLVLIFMPVTYQALRSDHVPQ
jgi:CzcA family heavy metal efflux pump